MRHQLHEKKKRKKKRTIGKKRNREPLRHHSTKKKNIAPSEEAQPTLGPWTRLEPVRLETPRTPKARMVPLYHGGPHYVENPAFHLRDL
ncbi:hypothetical protein E2C01_095844 [Portunus trituberculatus]|uniref:Uncharacterized protein n=1 Tax=Portunus trituberculatus TaxID=210409 RepID=A0A5B7K1G7_PORTR|nr:hypothetical protein [Portunus trituberculatus]